MKLERSCIDTAAHAAEFPAAAGQRETQEWRVAFHGDELVVLFTQQPLLKLKLRDDNGRITLVRHGGENVPAHLERMGLLAAAEALFATQPPGLRRFVLQSSRTAAIESLLAAGLLCLEREQFWFEAELLWQHAPLWLPASAAAASAYPQKHVVRDGKRHPQRPPKPAGILYRRFIPWLRQTLTLQTADPATDLAVFHRWMNHPRVAEFWQEHGSVEQHRLYLEQQHADAHSLPVIGRFDGRPFGYFEIYWAREDRIAPFCDAGDHDRGLHLLVGEDAYRGQAFYTAWFSSLCHYVFLDDPRTQRIVCEPRHDNRRQIANFCRSGFASLKHFDFPHKRALLVMLLRERFFAEQHYLPVRDGSPVARPAA